MISPSLAPQFVTPDSAFLLRPTFVIPQEHLVAEPEAQRHCNYAQTLAVLCNELLTSIVLQITFFFLDVVTAFHFFQNNL